MACTPLAVRVDTAAKMLDCSRAHLYNQIKLGNLRIVKVGASTRVPMSEIRRILGEHEATDAA